MFVVLVGGSPEQRSGFMDLVNSMSNEHDQIVWINNHRSFYYICNLFVHFGGRADFPASKLSITWSGDHQETLDRVYKTLGV